MQYNSIVNTKEMSVNTINHQYHSINTVIIQYNIIYNTEANTCKTLQNESVWHTVKPVSNIRTRSSIGSNSFRRV